MKEDKVSRVLSLYSQLMEGRIIKKSVAAQKYGVNERSIQRDIEDIRAFCRNCVALGDSMPGDLIYDYIEKGYRLDRRQAPKLSNSEVLALCKILLDSRAFVKTEMADMLHKVIACCVPESNQALITKLVNNETFHYVEPRHRTSFLDTMWQLGEAIQQHRYVTVTYGRIKDRKVVERRLKPLALLFSEYYFYLIAFIDDSNIQKIYEGARDMTPTIYRLDRIKNLTVEKDIFRIPYNRRFQEGEFRKRVQFMYGGPLQRVTFTYTGSDIDAVLDRLPTAKILSEENGTYRIEAEVYGKGVEMWLHSQGKNVSDVQIKEI
ncbi:WYL domain-containing protein [Megasphaera sp.]|uniref:helix-turn-helix transcriptional regulator n=1 Tax=Megasphaera TaxID=906 RepID=UPI001DBB03EC|nr:WYL domain-containing protein [Megasphaera sp.]MBS6789178.1 WYL domain-containing protein [Megasphaera sp.]